MARQLAYVSGDVFPTLNYGTATVLEYVGNSFYMVRFNDTGFVTTAKSGAIKSGKVRDLLGPSVAGVGCLGVGSHKPSYVIDGVRKTNPLHILWSSMINRCYDEKTLERSPTYRGCTVCPEWLNFQTFCDTVKHIPGYMKWVSYKAGIPSEPYALDKDKLVDGNKVYSPETCCFITISENSTLALAARK